MTWNILWSSRDPDRIFSIQAKNSHCYWQTIQRVGRTMQWRSGTNIRKCSVLTVHFLTLLEENAIFLNPAVRSHTNKNTRLFPVFRLRSEKWMDVQVGDIIKLENNQFVTVSELLELFPLLVALLSSSPQQISPHPLLCHHRDWLDYL